MAWISPRFSGNPSAACGSTSKCSAFKSPNSGRTSTATAAFSTQRQPDFRATFLGDCLMALYKLLIGLHVDTDADGKEVIHKQGDVFESKSDLLGFNGRGMEPKFEIVTGKAA